MLCATFLSLEVQVYLQQLLRNAPEKLPSSGNRKIWAIFTYLLTLHHAAHPNLLILFVRVQV